MKILFHPGSCIPFHAGTLDERPLGGTETAVIRLSESLEKKGVRCYVATSLNNPKLTRPRYVPEGSISLIGPVDATVVVRDWRVAFSSHETRKRLFWSGDATDQPIHIGLGDKRIASRFDLLLAVSEWHRKTTGQHSGFPAEKIAVLRNGVHAPFFEKQIQKIRKRLIYSSTPYRGLRHLVRLFPQIKAREPEAELVVCSGYGVYADAQGKYDPVLLKDWEELRQRLMSIPGVTVKGNMPQAGLAEEFLKAAVLAYPNVFPETSCISIMEAQSAGCVPVTTARAALPETVSHAGVLIDGEPGTPEYDAQFIEKTVELLSNDQVFSEYSNNGIAHRAALSWDARADEFLALIEKLLGSP